MINTALLLKDPIDYIFKNSTNKEVKKVAFSNNDWIALRQLENIFLPFLKASIQLQGQFYTTIPYSLLYIYQLYNKLEELPDSFQEKSNSSSLVSI
jgi:hypothetical protein